MDTDSSLFANEIGEGYPILIIHGWEMDGKVEELDFEPIFTKIQGFRRIYVDLPGMGRTPAKGVKDQDGMYLRLKQFIDTRLPDSRFLLAGSSCGAYLARAVAQEYTERVDGLLLRVPLIEPNDSLRDRVPFQAIVSDEQIMSSMSTEDKMMLGDDILVQTTAYIRSVKAKYKQAYLPAIEAADKEVLGPIREDPKRYALSHALDKETTKLLAPTLILCGRQDGVVGYRDSLRLLELYPRSTFAVLDRAGHGLPVDDSGVFDALVNDWLIRISEWRAQQAR